MSQTEVQLIKADSVVTADIANSAVTDAKISALTSSKLSGALPAISGASLTNLPASGKVHNLVINGAMNVAQRGTSSTSSGFQTVDRFAHYGSGWDEAITQSQSDVASGTTPYTSGFRKAFKLQNGNQTGGAGTGDQLYISHKLEAQDIATSGWNYTSASSYVTLSFWVKSSVAQNFYGYLKTADGTAQNYPFETGSLTADTWTKITKTISGNSNLQFDLNNDVGIELVIAQWFGTDKTGTLTLNAWGAWSSSNRLPDFGAAMDDWYTTNDATFEMTGVQLEVGDSATDFEHRSFGQELLLCQRYYRVLRDSGEDGIGYLGLMSYNYDVNSVTTQVNFIPEMRATPTADSTVGTNYYRYYRNSGYVDINSMSVLNGMGRKGGAFNNADSGNGTAGQAGGIVLNNSSAKIAFSAEL